MAALLLLEVRRPFLTQHEMRGESGQLSPQWNDGWATEASNRTASAGGWGKRVEQSKCESDGETGQTRKRDGLQPTRKSTAMAWNGKKVARLDEREQTTQKPRVSRSGARGGLGLGERTKTCKASSREVSPWNEMLSQHKGKLRGGRALVSVVWRAVFGVLSFPSSSADSGGDPGIAGDPKWR
ncbi:hypothetical protein GQ53DRAFT_766651 [Thozetella sp. PMI_491]|nr:hypothetical protein GQ53DRAFT_766651 [Thozetella sp. PMI_491]